MWDWREKGPQLAVQCRVSSFAEPLKPRQRRALPAVHRVIPSRDYVMPAQIRGGGPARVGGPSPEGCLGLGGPARQLDDEADSMRPSKLRRARPKKC